MALKRIVAAPGGTALTPNLSVYDDDSSPADVAAAIATHAALAADVHGLLPSTATNRDVYISATLGSDANDGLTKLTPLASIYGYFQKYGSQRYQGSTDRVWLAGVGGADPWVRPNDMQLHVMDMLPLTQTPLLPNAVVFRGPTEMLLATAWMTSGPATCAMDNPPAQVVDETDAANPAGLRTQILCTGAAPGWTAHDLGPEGSGLFLRISRAGEKRIWELPIADNTADTIIVDTLGVVGNILNTDTLEIVIPGAGITGSVDLGGGMYMAQLRNVHAGAPSGFTAPPTAADQGSLFERLDVSAYAARCEMLAFDRCRFRLVALISCTDTSIHNCAAPSKLDLNHGSSVDGGIGSRPDSATDPATVLSGAVIMARGIELNRGSHLEVKEYSLCSYGSPDAGITVSRSSNLYQNDGCPYVGGNRNAGAGVSASIYGSVRLRGGINSTITGTVGDLEIGKTGAAVAYGTGAGEFEEGAGYKGNLHNTYVDAGGVTHGDFSRIYK